MHIIAQKLPVVYTRRTWIEPQSAVTGMSVVNTYRMK